MANAQDVKMIAHGVLDKLFVAPQPVDKKTVQDELDRIITNNQDTIKTIPASFVADLAKIFSGQKFDPAAYAARVGAMTDDELITEINANAAAVAEVRKGVEGRDKLLKDLRDTGIELARRAVVAALFTAVS